MSMATLVCGIDEAGLGSWAGPLCAACVVLDPARPVVGLDDSKKLSAVRRKELRSQIERYSLAVGVGWAEASEIDRIGLTSANHRAMERAMAEVEGIMSGAWELTALIDGRSSKRGPVLGCSKRFIIGGDATEPAISAASIIAKTSRDALMYDLDARYPGYGLARHKGYGVGAHAQALNRLGPSPIHRLSFEPVARAHRDPSRCVR